MSEDDLPRDAHLRASLRHAPDAAIGPSAALSESILAEARAKARTPQAAPAKRRHPLLAAWDALTQPAVGTAVAGLTVATVVGLMWWQGPGDEALPARAPVPSSAPAPAAPAAPTPAPDIRAQAPAPVSPPAPQETLRKKELSERRTTGEVQRRAPAPAPVEEKATADSSAAERAQLEVAPRAERARAAATAAANAKSESAQAEVERRQNRLFVPPPAPDLAGLRAALSAESSRWTWRYVGENEARSVDAALDDWLAKVETATRGTWRRIAAPDKLPSRELRLMQDGRVRHLLQLEGERITWLADDGSAWQALLPPSLQEGPAR